MTERCNCGYCGKVIHKPPKIFKKNVHNFCSTTCYGNWCKGKNMEERRKKYEHK